MNNSMIYRVYNKEFKVIPFTAYDRELLIDLQSKVSQYFDTELFTENYHEVIVLSGSESIILADESQYPELGKINRVWRNLNRSYKIFWREWQEAVNRYLDPLDYTEGVFRLAGYSRVYVLLTDYINSENQVYKIHCGIEFLLIYLESMEGAVMFHSCCGGFRNDDLYLFIGQSGVGKSTIADKIIKDCGYVVDDERNFVVRRNDLYQVFSGQNEAISKAVGCSNLESGELKKILFIHQSLEEFVEETTPDDENFNKIIVANKEVGGYRETFPKFIKKLNKYFIWELLHHLPVYNIYLRKDSDIRELLSDISCKNNKEGVVT